MTRLVLCLLLLATGASAEQLTDDIVVVHDQKRGATCWVPYNGYGTPQAIFCIPDSQLQAGNERQLSPHEKDSGPTPALAPGRWIDERYEL
ncbi:hypothetical protein K3F44_08975 [Pseudomonas sp. S07E 245]|uniref:hypothetical protein n=1 Tax=Pseudomonas sp. S07E 245 TaxID=2866278 RepID=UPI001C730007|nr:hypothetical protein [Pseudomonas sp. S07E 245]QYX54404.1 hypothetical protein K3F44_08975 [Pseudomonas sp. S07E 245]